jgi:hypothetical protein
MSEFNSSTYTAITLTGAAKLASYSRTPEVRELALQIEHRLWAEVLLHYHPSTRMQAGPQSRAYAVDCAGHNHTLQAVLWMAFGAQAIGRNLLASDFDPDGTEVVHFAGHYLQNVAEFTDAIDSDLHIPDDLALLIAQRRYPATLRGRSECISRLDGMAAPYHTETYMEEDFSLGTVSGPLGGGEQTATCYVTYKRRKDAVTFCDAATVFARYLTTGTPVAEMMQSKDGSTLGEGFVSNQGWWYSAQKKNTALMLVTPNLKSGPIKTESLRLSVIFPAHYGNISKSVIGDGPCKSGAHGESEVVAPVSVEAGEVYIHIFPLLPTDLARKHALRFSRCLQYEVLDLFNYEGPSRTVTRQQASVVLNGMVMTVESKAKFTSLDAFHRKMSDAVIQDYFVVGHRDLLFQRDDVEFEFALTTDPFGVQTETIEGRTINRPVFETNQLDVSRFPFVSGSAPRDRPMFPWETLDICWYPESPWLIGSRGDSSRRNYADPTSGPRLPVNE